MADGAFPAFVACFAVAYVSYLKVRQVHFHEVELGVADYVFGGAGVVDEADIVVVVEVVEGAHHREHGGDAATAGEHEVFF